MPRCWPSSPRNNGATTLGLRQKLAAKAYARTAAYDAAISNWFADQLKIEAPDFRAFGGRLAEALRYGENPHQTAAFYRTPQKRAGVATARQVQGKQLSYNNINDTDAAYECIGEFDAGAHRRLRHRQARQPVRRRRGRRSRRRLPQGAGLRSDLGVRRHHRHEPSARCRHRARDHRDLHRGDHRAGRERRGDRDHRRERRTCACCWPAACPIRARAGLTFKTVAGGMLVQTRDNAIVDEMNLKTVTQRRAEQGGAARPEVRVPRRQAREVQHHRLCEGPCHGRHRRRPDEPRRCGAHCRRQGRGRGALGKTAGADDDRLGGRLRRLLPVRRRPAGRDRSRRHRGDPAGRLDARRRGDRRPPTRTASPWCSPGSGISGIEALRIVDLEPGFASLHRATAPS